MIILSHSGKQHSYQVAKTLHNINQLDSFITSSYLRNETLQNYFKKTQNTFWTRRYIEGLPKTKIIANWRFEIPEFILRSIQGKSYEVQKAVYKRDVNFDKYVAHKIAGNKKSISTFWGFQGSCLESLRVANEKGMTSICELATAHVVAAKRILGEEAKLHPEWSDSIDNLIFPSNYEKRLEEEPLTAQKVVAASMFTKKTLKEIGIAEKNIIYLPLGFELEHVPYQENKNDNFENRPLKLLYAGTITQRKGIKYLLEAMKNLSRKDIELHLVGGIQGSGKALKNYKEFFHYHPPVSQKEMFNMYNEFDALVLPTIFEGFGLVIVEAMAAGLPVITTSHSIGPELIHNNENGYLIGLRNVEELTQAISALREKRNQEYSEMRKCARNAALNYSWNNYGNRLEKIITSWK